MAIPQSEIYSRVIDQPFESESYTKELEGNSKNIKLFLYILYWFIIRNGNTTIK